MEKWENCVERDLEVWKVGLKAERNQSKNLIYYFRIRRPNQKVRIKLVKVFFSIDYTKYFSSVEKSDILVFHTVWCAKSWMEWTFLELFNILKKVLLVEFWWHKRIWKGSKKYCVWAMSIFEKKLVFFSESSCRKIYIFFLEWKKLAFEKKKNRKKLH